MVEPYTKTSHHGSSRTRNSRNKGQGLRKTNNDRLFPGEGRKRAELCFAFFGPVILSKGPVILSKAKDLFRLHGPVILSKAKDLLRLHPAAYTFAKKEERAIDD